MPGKTSSYPYHMPEENHPPGKDETKKISKLIRKAANYAGSAKTTKPLSYVPTITNYTQLWWVPNVVAHQKEGIEAVHLATGRTVCKLHLTEGGLHADINGDGVLDHVQVTAYFPSTHDHEAIWQWQMLTGSTWSNLPSPSGMMEPGTVFPTLKAFSLRIHDVQGMILAAGDQEAVVISPGGSILTSVDLPAPPTHALLTGDFSNDGLTNLIVVTSNGVYGFCSNQTTRSPFLQHTSGVPYDCDGRHFCDATPELNEGKTSCS